MYLATYRTQLAEALHLRAIGSTAIVIGYAADLPPYDVEYVETIVDDQHYTHTADDLSDDVIEGIVGDVQRRRRLGITPSPRKRAYEVAKAIVARRYQDYEISRMSYKITRIVLLLRLSTIDDMIDDATIIDTITSLSMRELAVAYVTDISARILADIRAARSAS